MALIVKNDEQIIVGTTPGLLTGASSFTFDGTNGKPDYRGYEIVISELTGGRGILANGLDFEWDQEHGIFNFLQLGDIFLENTYYNVHFQPAAQPLAIDTSAIINSGFFIRDINLVNLTEPEVLDRLTYFIQKYESECLRRILGYELHQALLNETSDRMTDLIYGVEYIDYRGELKKWQGLVHDSNMSLIANYIYFYFQQANALQTTGTGTTSRKQEAGKTESPKDKMVHAWKFFASEARDMAYFLWNSSTDLGAAAYPEFTYSQYQRTMNLARQGGVNRFDF